LKPRVSPPSNALTTSYAVAAKVFNLGSVASAGDVFAMNFLMDRDVDHWAHELSALKAQVGACDTTASIVPSGALSGEFTWRCENGRVRGQVLLAPTPTPRIQSLTFTRLSP
jgi:hypothetical protein